MLRVRVRCRSRRPPSTTRRHGSSARHLGPVRDGVRRCRRARPRLPRKRAPLVTKPAIVLDIDETSLSNWPAYRLNGWARITTGGCDAERGPCGIRAWQALATSKALRPTLELATRADAMGVAVFFITGRPAELREATERNLRQEGYKPTGVILQAPGATFKSAADFKTPERRKVAG